MRNEKCLEVKQSENIRHINFALIGSEKFAAKKSEKFFFSRKRAKRMRNGSRFASFRFKANNFFWRNRRTLLLPLFFIFLQVKFTLSSLASFLASTAHTELLFTYFLLQRLIWMSISSFTWSSISSPWALTTDLELHLSPWALITDLELQPSPWAPPPARWSSFPRCRPSRRP